MENNNLRNSNIELLRIILMIFVVTLHYNGMCGNALTYCTSGFNFYFTRFTESLSICAVDCFMIISGYFLAYNKEIKLNRILHILGIVIGINLFTQIVSIFLTGNISLKSVIKCFLPQNYFSTFYIITYILSPFINSIFEKIETQKKTIFFISIIAILFLVYPTVYDSLNAIYEFNLSGLDTINGAGAGNAGGYTIVNFIVMYCIGAFLRRFQLEVKTIHLIITYISSLLLIFLNLLFLSATALCYYNIFVVINAVSLFLLFIRVNFSNKIINYVSTATFGVFCLHVSRISSLLWNKFQIEQVCTIQFGIIINSIVSVSIMTIICYIIDLLLQLLVSPIRKFFNKTKLYSLSFSIEKSEQEVS